MAILAEQGAFYRGVNKINSGSLVCNEYLGLSGNYPAVITPENKTESLNITFHLKSNFPVFNMGNVLNKEVSYCAGRSYNICLVG